MWAIVAAKVLVVAPSPKFQKRFVMNPVELSVKVTDNGAIPLTGTAVKAATGGAVCEQQIAAVRAIESIYSPTVAGAFLRSSNPQLDDEAPLAVLATQPVGKAEQAVLAAARAFLEG